MESDPSEKIKISKEAAKKLKEIRTMSEIYSLGVFQELLKEESDRNEILGMIAESLKLL